MLGSSKMVVYTLEDYWVFIRISAVHHVSLVFNQRI